MSYHPLDGLTAQLTAFTSFSEMVNAPGGYRPTIQPRYGREYLDLADGYDAFQAARGDDRRAYRGGHGPASIVAPRSPEGFLSVRFAGVPAGSGLYSEWLRAIHAINGNPGGGDLAIGTPLPESHEDSDRTYVEEYPTFRVILRYTAWGHSENSGTIQAKTAEAEAQLRAAAQSVTGRPLPTKGE